MDRYSILLSYLGLVLAVLICYCNVYNNEFLFDDNLLITLNEYLKSWTTLDKLLTGSTISGVHIFGGFYRPLQMLLYFFIYQTLGAIPFGFHALNVLLHAANTCLLFALGRRMNFNAGACFLACLIWAMHPLHTEAITYMSGTADPLCMFFCLGGLLVLFPDFSQRRILLALVFLTLGLLSKETAVVFPFLATATFYVKKRSESLLRPDFYNYLRIWPLWLMIFVYILWRSLVPGFDGPQSYNRFYDQHNYTNYTLYAGHFSYRIYTFFAMLPAYLQLIVWPADLHMERGFPVFVEPWFGSVITGLLLCAASVTQIFYARRIGLPLAWGLLWFGISFSPNSGILVAMNALFLEHWMYMPLAGLALGLAQTAHLGILKYSGSKPMIERGVIAIALLVALSLAIATFEQNKIWKDPIVFYNNIFKYGEVTARSHNNLALAYMDLHEYDKAIDEFKKAIEISDTYAETQHNLGLALLSLPDQSGHMDEAIEHFKRAIEISPGFFRSYGMLSTIYNFRGDKTKAEEYRKKFEETSQTITQ